MLAPGAKGWISKYFDLVEKNEIKVSIRNYEGLSKLKHLHLTFSRSGIIFGLPTRAIFASKLDTVKWTTEEKLKLLLFESMLFTYLKTGEKLDKDAFVSSLLSFYGKHNGRSIMKTMTFFLKESDEEKVESIFAKRIDIKLNLFENKWWVNSLTNLFVYLDVILYHDFLKTHATDTLEQYSDFAQNALTAITLSSYADGVIDDHEKDMFNHFLASANLGEEQRELAIKKFKKGAKFEDLSPFVNQHWLLKRFLLDVAILTVYSSLHTDQSEIDFIEDFRKFLDIPKVEVDQTIMFLENFIIENREQTTLLKDSPSYEKVYSRFTERWYKILWRNKDKLTLELKESKELVALIKKSMTEELTVEEKEKVKQQSKDILKSMPAFAVFMIPGGTILLPMMMKILPDLLPSAFKDNEIED